MKQVGKVDTKTLWDDKRPSQLCHVQKWSVLMSVDNSSSSSSSVTTNSSWFVKLYRQAWIVSVLWRTLQSTSTMQFPLLRLLLSMLLRVSKSRRPHIRPMLLFYRQYVTPVVWRIVATRRIDMSATRTRQQCLGDVAGASGTQRSGT